MVEEKQHFITDDDWWRGGGPAAVVGKKDLRKGEKGGEVNTGYDRHEAFLGGREPRKILGGDPQGEGGGDRKKCQSENFPKEKSPALQEGE